MEICYQRSLLIITHSENEQNIAHQSPAGKSNKIKDIISKGPTIALLQLHLAEVSVAITLELHLTTKIDLEGPTILLNQCLGNGAQCHVALEGRSTIRPDAYLGDFLQFQMAEDILQNGEGVGRGLPKDSAAVGPPASV